MRRLKQTPVAHRKDAELDVTPFMNMMMMLVSALLASVVFQNYGDRSRFPGGQRNGRIDPDLVHLEVIVRDDQMSSRTVGVAQSKPCRRSTVSRTSRGCRS
jgi:biopolymer transport protein ExbD